MIPESEFNRVSQVSHLGWGALVPFAAYSFAGMEAALIASAVYTAFFAVKEAWWDEKYETEEVCGIGWRDFAWSFAGTAVALVSLGIHSCRS